jgi:hypothetical protein
MIAAIHRMGLIRLARVCLVVACVHIVPVMGQGAVAESTAKSGKHLFILSGQSNMTKNLMQGFSAKVEEAYGKENVTIAMSMKSGRGIRYWCAGYRYSDNHPPSEQEQRDNGSLYPPLIEAIKAAAGDHTFATVTFIWMQGESDAGRSHADVYAESFLKLFQRLETDLKRDDVKFVIGRLSDFDMKNLKNPHWTKMREVQVKLAEDHKDGEWIDTDDLIQEDPNASGDLHYRPAESIKLGERFAAKAIEMIGPKQPSTPAPQ